VFNVGPLELMVLALVGLVVLGPDRLPGLARDAARMLRTLRELATGAREQLRDELGPEFADVDLRNLNPRTAIQRAVFGDEELPDLSKYDPRRFDARAAAKKAMYGDDEDETADADEAAADTAADADAGLGVSAADVQAVKPVSFDKRTEPTAPAATDGRPRPRPRPGPGSATSSFDDAT
jgi:sec-independent protein translocase protein TatB